MRARTYFKAVVSEFLQPSRTRALVVLLAIFFGGLTPSPAAVLGSINQIFAGNDPSERFDFTPTFDPSQPSVLRFEGIVTNQRESPFDTAMRFNLQWRNPDDSIGEVLFPELPQYFSGLDLPGADPDPVPVPAIFQAELPFHPGWVSLAVEGLGPSDDFRLVGDLTLDAIPEPSACTLLLGIAIAVALRRRR